MLAASVECQHSVLSKISEPFVTVASVLAMPSRRKCGTMIGWRLFRQPSKSLDSRKPRKSGVVNAGSDNTMRELGPASSDEMVLSFLRAEIDSPTWWPRYARVLNAHHLNRSSLIDNADLNDSRSNHDRGIVLGEVRGYGRDEGLFQGLPLDTKWRRVSLDPTEFQRLRYINNDEFWRNLTGGTRSVQDGARNYKGSRITAGVDDVLRKIRQGASIPELILVEDMRGGLVVLEGHTRATAFVIARSNPISALVGTSPAMHQWTFI